MEQIVTAIINICENDTIFSHKSVDSSSVLKSEILKQINNETLPIGVIVNTKTKMNDPITLLKSEPSSDEQYLWGYSLVQQYGINYSDMYQELNVVVPDDDSPFVIDSSQKKIAISGRLDGTFCAKYHVSNLRSMASSQLSNLFLVDVDVQTIAERKKFDFNNVKYYTGFSIDSFTDMILDGTIKLNIDMELHKGMFKNNGSTWFIDSESLSELYNEVYNLNEIDFNSIHSIGQYNPRLNSVEDDWASYDRKEIEIQKRSFDDII